MAGKRREAKSPELTDEAIAEMQKQRNQEKLARVKTYLDKEGVEAICFPRLVPMDQNFTRWIIDTSAMQLRIIPPRGVPDGEEASKE